MKRVYSEEENLKFINAIVDKYVKTHGWKKIADKNTK